MKKAKKSLTAILFLLIGLTTNIQSAQGQASLKNNLATILTSLEEKSDNYRLKKLIREAKGDYANDSRNNSLYEKFLTIDSLSIKTLSLDRKVTLSFATAVQQLFKDSKYVKMYATSLMYLGDLYVSMGEYDKALPLYTNVAAIRKALIGEKSLEYGRSLNKLGELYNQTGQYEKALSFDELALDIRKKVLGEETLEYAYNLSNLGALHQQMGEYDKAMPLYKQALDIVKKTSGILSLEYAFALNNSAILYFRIGQHQVSFSLLKQSVEIIKKLSGEVNYEYARSLNNLANSYSSLGQYDTALPLYKKALGIRRQVLGEDNRQYANSLVNLGNLYYHIGKFDSALELELKALEIRKKLLGEKHPEYANSIYDLGNLYYAMGQYKNALLLDEKALTLTEEVLGKEHPNYATILKNLGAVYTAVGKPENASTLLVEASRITLKHLSQTFSTLSEQEKISFLNKQSSEFNNLPSLLYTQHLTSKGALTQLYTNELVLKGMVLEDQKRVVSTIRQSNDSNLLVLYEQWRFNKALISKQMLLPLRTRLSYLDTLIERTTRLEEQLSTESTSFHNQLKRQTISLKDISQSLVAGEAAVEFTLFRLYNKRWTDSIIYAALVLLPRDTTPYFIPLFEQKKLQSLLKSSSRQVNTFRAVQKLYGNDSLYQLIWQPLEKYLTRVKTVYYAPTGLLHRIAFPAMRTTSGELLIDKYKFDRQLSTRSVTQAHDITKKPVSAGIWGNINYYNDAENLHDQTKQETRPKINSSASSFSLHTSRTREAGGKEWGLLPGTKNEMESISRELVRAGTATFIDSGSLATENVFKSLDGKSPEVLHFATHGFFLPLTKAEHTDSSGYNAFTVQQNPMFRSGLVLAGANRAWKGETTAGKEDGILTAYEIAQMDLSNTTLVVLSACKTALGDLEGNEGVIGLQRAFKMAGVKQIILSLWSVPDKETAELMTNFYHNWMNGQSTRDALRSAQLKMKEKHPAYYWAAFELIE